MVCKEEISLKVVVVERRAWAEGKGLTGIVMRCSAQHPCSA